ncbi:hypothetical protein GGR61_004273, partial [Xanthomonas arboricola]|nr:hypothetical protein [Xanthomonas sp. 3058]
VTLETAPCAHLFPLDQWHNLLIQLGKTWGYLRVRFTYKGSLTPYFHARESIFSRAEPAAWVVSM